MYEQKLFENKKGPEFVPSTIEHVPVDEVDKSINSIVDPERFTNVSVYTYANGDRAYKIEMDVLNQSAGDGQYFWSERFLLVDMREGEYVGTLDVRREWMTDQEGNEIRSFNPNVGFAKTQDKFLKQGTHERRLQLANQWVIAKYGTPLSSDSKLNPQSEGAWLKLVERGEAEQVRDKGHKYQFVQK